MAGARHPSPPLRWGARVPRALGGCLVLASACLLALSWPRAASAGWPPAAENDGVYGRLGGNTDASLKLGGLWSQSQLSGSVGISAHYYSLIGATLDYSDSLNAEAAVVRSLSFGADLRPLFLPRWLLGSERGPAWLDLTLDSASVGFGAYFSRLGPAHDDARGVWMSFGLGVPFFARAGGPWIEVREVRRWPDHEASHLEAHNALLVYLSWHQMLQLGQGH